MIQRPAQLRHLPCSHSSATIYVNRAVVGLSAHASEVHPLLLHAACDLHGRLSNYKVHLRTVTVLRGPSFIYPLRSRHSALGLVESYERVEVLVLSPQLLQRGNTDKAGLKSPK